MRSRMLAAAAVLAWLPGCAPAPETPKKETKAEAKPPATAPDVFKVRLETTKGDIVMEIHKAWSPRGAEHFYRLVTSKFYDGVKFHRVLKQFVAQFGINGDPQIQGLYATLRIDDDPPKQKNRRGMVTFAKLGPNSRTTEVFINLRDNAVLDSGGFAPIGKVVEGMDVADKLTYLYGELAPRGAGPDPAKAARLGVKYLERDFPRLDAIKTARVVFP